VTLLHRGCGGTLSAETLHCGRCHDVATTSAQILDTERRCPKCFAHSNCIAIFAVYDAMGPFHGERAVRVADEYLWRCANGHESSEVRAVPRLRDAALSARA
jgi:hypothetical protein